MSLTDKAQELVEEGFEALNAGALERAATVGEQLIAMQHSAGYELLALTYERQGEPAKAVELLEEATTKAPQVWVLWQLLGNYYSVAERFDQAQEAYRSALQCAGASKNSVGLNSAVAFTRAGDDHRALEILAHIGEEDPQIWLAAQIETVAAQLRLGELEQAVAEVNRVTERVAGQAFADYLLSDFLAISAEVQRICNSATD